MKFSRWPVTSSSYFYRNHQDNDILVKALLNEHEVTMPVTTDKAPYYHWDDVKRYYTEKLNRFSSAHPDLMPTVPADYSPGKTQKKLSECDNKDVTLHPQRRHVCLRET